MADVSFLMNHEFVKLLVQTYGTHDAGEIANKLRRRLQVCSSVLV